MTASSQRAELVVDLAAIRHNVALLSDVAASSGAEIMAVVKADAYGHGLLEVARAARAAGAGWLGVATPEEALRLREAGDTGRVLCWLTAPDEDWTPWVAAGLDLSAYSVDHLDAAAGAGRARVHLKVDTGLSRGGAARDSWDTFFARAAALEAAGEIEVVGIWSHLVAADEPDNPVNDRQEAVFEEAVALARSYGLAPRWRHLANSAATLARPSMRYDLVRCGIAVYGLAPAPGVIGDPGLRPAMTARTRLAMVKRAHQGDGVSYSHLWTAPADTTLGLVPAGYADGIPRSASNVAEVFVAGRRRPMRGRVCMDQFVVDLSDDDVDPGAEAILFGSGAHGEPTAQDWAEAAGTINYEIVTRIGGRFVRRYVDSALPGGPVGEEGQ